MTNDVLHDMYHMAIKYAPEPKENEKYNVKVTKRKTKFDIDYDKINEMIKTLKPKRAIRLRLYDHSSKNYHEDVDLVIKAYTHFNRKLFSMKVFYVNNKENIIHPMMVEYMGRPYEAEFIANSTQFGMKKNMNEAIAKILSMCHKHFYVKKA